MKRSNKNMTRRGPRRKAAGELAVVLAELEAQGLDFIVVEQPADDNNRRRARPGAGRGRAISGDFQSFCIEVRE